MIAKDLMTVDFKFAEVPGTRQEVLELFKKYGVSGLPVVKKGTRKVLGIVTRNDMMLKPSETQLALIMSRNPMTISENTPIEEIAKIMLEKNISYLPVVEGEEMKGLVTIADVVWKGLTHLELKESIKPYVQRKITAVWEQTPINVAYIILRLARTQSLLVLDNSGQLAGIVTDSDIVSKSEVKIEASTSNLHSTGEGAEWDWESASILYITKRVLHLPETPISEIMVRNVITVNEYTSISDCADKMRVNDIDQMPVLNAEGELIGLIRDVDLLRSLVSKRTD
ncbi:MAG: CBS domain-containing protein [Candidatus Odinarchaeum yellowstonii]|uniref:CBS domain-containing protein n=1 Tax=Odinarchaeota yellowstonii (strain LCB_4) TaxID=1841599 RepID=A0AAF0IAS5_ODILC|nr:MAG: CBS domain-containing protein [Candidatus Odinarchaeum yellowstonii]